VIYTEIASCNFIAVKPDWVGDDLLLL